jgi:hypothetical protein
VVLTGITHTKASTEPSSTWLAEICVLLTVEGLILDMIVDEVVVVDGLTTTYGAISIGAISIALLSLTVALVTITTLDPLFVPTLVETLLAAIVAFVAVAKLLLTIPFLLAV